MQASVPRLATVGIAPFRIVCRRILGVVPIRQVEFLGYRGSKVCADHLDFLTQAQHREVITTLLKGEWDALELADLAEESLILRLLSQIRGDYRVRPISGTQQQCLYIKLPDGWSSLLGSLKKIIVVT